MPAAQAPPAHMPPSVRAVAPIGQVAFEHGVPSAYFWHPPPPSHLPFVPQVAAPRSVQNVAGAGVPAARGAHAPVPETLQAWHAGQLGLPQQTPSTQLPLMHWLPIAHARPLALSAQLRVAPAPWQVKGGTQSASVAHVVLHADEPQTYGVQLAGAGAAQVPAPVQCEIGVKVATEQEAMPHATLVPPCSQAPPPLQLPVLPQGGLAGQPPCGSGAPAWTLAHEPVAQVWQRPHDEAAQHTPSTQ
jgi:hypothetical protein